jgi:uncharacterized protein (TIGR02466 family)
MQAFIENWFQTPIILVDASDLLPLARKVFSTTDFKAFTNDLYPNGFSTYYCDSNEHFYSHEEVQPIIQTIIDTSSLFGEQQGVSRDTHRSCVKSIWMSRMNKGASHSRHVHGDAHLCGTLYVDAPENAASIRFHSPVSTVIKFCPMPVSADGNPYTSLYVDHSPSPGKLVLWPGWLEHEVLLNEVEGNRDSISFNIVFERIK